MEKELQEWHRLHQFHLYCGSYETRDLAEFLGVSVRTIQRWLKEKTKPNGRQLGRINKYLELQKDTKEAL